MDAASSVNSANSSVNSQTASSVVSSTDSLGESDFLRLFTTQLQYQDPMQPMDGSAFTSQLAQFSSLEQLTNLNSGLTKLYSETTANGLVGRYVQTTDGTTGQVIGVDYSTGAAKLMLDNNSTIGLSDIVEVRQSL
ncbi:MAG: hypothetical protein M0Z59_00580 [Nitrospiraceae bacterium]|nr:hypothetical protein [Nitrospiraceae bacterium]